MNIKMIVLDLDRTLLRSDKSISEYTLATLNKCKREGIKIVIASARPRRAVRKFAELIGCEDIICLNGAMVTINDKIIETHKIDKHIAHNLILKIMEMYPTSKLSAEINDYIYANFDLTEIFTSVENVMITDFKEIECDVDKIIFGVEDEKEVANIISLLPHGLYGKVANGHLLQIMSNNATKLEGIKTLAEYYNITLNNVAAFGDDNDDIEMINNCGYGVAVANAIADVLAVANYITESSDEDGVAKWIELNIYGGMNEDIRNKEINIKRL